ncbi:MAG TPA: hypothetical protein DD490_20730 [Acidobacteria bacterium]|nr:hypothetical protein [Acidobacteriota bacterium]
MKRFNPFGASATGLLGLAALLTLAAAGPARADDRDLLRDAAGEPYIFILLDTSGSMSWSPRCPITTPDPLNPSVNIQVPANPADCALLCPDGDCFVPLQADDPKSKFYQAKQALYEVVQAVDGVQLGFGTFNQDYLAVRNKHWMYQAANDGPTITGYGAFPATGDQEVFGQTWTCDEGAGDPRTACNPTVPADLDDAWEVARLRRLPKGHLAFTTTITVYVRYAGTTWRLRYVPTGAPTPGASVTVNIERARCLNPLSGCTSRDLVVTQAVVFNPVAEFLAWDTGVKRANPQQGFFSQTSSSDTTASNDCAGWDPNNDHTTPVLAPYLDPPASGYNLRWPTITGDSRGSFFDSGDVLPLDWNNDHKTDILGRLAPNTIGSPLALPDFSISRYFNDTRVTLPAAETYLRLKDSSRRPLLAVGDTPLGASVRNFRKWYSGCDTGVCGASAGWKGVAAAQDADWGCRRKYLLVLTDGDERCSGDPCAATLALKSNENVLTYVVAFGFDSTITPNKLQCMASNGGTGQPYFPENKDELVETLTTIFSQIKEEASSFASAAVPSVQAEVADRIYLSSFTPLNGESFWDGHLDAFLKPLPLDAAGRPDESIACSSLPESERSSCHLWDAGEKLEEQAPTAASLAAAAVLDASVLKIGPAEDQRRVFYAKAASGSDVPRSLRLFYPPTGDPATDADWSDLFQGFNLPGAAAARRTRTLGIFRNTLGIKSGTIGTTSTTYVLGDVFHSDPVLIDRPNDFFAYAANLHSENGCGYKCFADKHRYRRKMLLVGSNDAQLHFFDAGIWDPDPTDRKFTTGTGVEVVSVIPRLLLPAVRELAEKPRHVIGVDGTPRIEDVFVDPIHNGTPTASERQWRTVVFGGLREGGSPLGAARISDFVSGYYALDITQPDKVSSITGEPLSQSTLPDCLSQTNLAVSGCGDLPFPSLLWEFTDSTSGSRWDEDLNGFPDLGETWSVPTIGRVKVTNSSSQVEERFVAIFGGGMDAAHKTSPQSGTWLYMVDVETGQPLYKRQLVGAAAADPAAVDVDVDGFLDTLYIGTTAGFLYKIDLSEPASLTSVTLAKEKGLPDFAADVTVTRVEDPDPAVLSSSSWDPVPIFDTGGKPIYFAPVAFYVASLNRFALAFGTGDREDLWDFDSDVEGRFYMIVDDEYGPTEYAAGTIPLDESQFQLITPDGSASDPGADYVLHPEGSNKAGWYMNLGEGERVITQAFGLAGVLVFSSYLPSREDPDVVTGLCARSGTSRIFVVYANNADAIMTVDGSKSRYRTVPEFVTNPYVEQGATKNPASSGDGNSENLSAEQLEILKTLKSFFPPGTKFGNYWISVSGIRSDTGYERYATIPIGILERNWKEH